MRFATPPRFIAIALLAAVTIPTVNAVAQAREERDPGRVAHDPSAAGRARAGKAVGEVNPPAYMIKVTPTYGWTDDTHKVGGQFAYTSDDLVKGSSVRFAALAASLSSAGQSNTRTQLDAEIDHDINTQMTVVVAGEWQHTANAANVWQLMPEVDINYSENVSFGGIGYIGQAKAVSGGPSSSANAFGVVGTIKSGDWKFAPEYDFKALDATEDDFSVKVSWQYTKEKKTQPWIFGTFGKHNRFSVGAVLRLH